MRGNHDLSGTVAGCTRGNYDLSGTAGGCTRGNHDLSGTAGGCMTGNYDLSDTLLHIAWCTGKAFRVLSDTAGTEAGRSGRVNKKLYRKNAGG